MAGSEAKPISATSVLAVEGIEFLLSKQGKVMLSSLNQKPAFLFFSANWCRPCRIFTPKLVQVYESLMATEREMGIVLVSLDRDEDRFMEYFRDMPWMAVPFDSHLTKKLCNLYLVRHIPFLIPLSSKGELIGELDVVQLIEDYGIKAFPFDLEREKQLKNMDEAKCRGGPLEDLLTSGERDYVVDRDCNKISISELTGKTIGLYFGGRWSPPCQAFTKFLTDVFNDLNVPHCNKFQVVFVSADSNQEEFDENISSMPWLTIPYSDRTHKELSRIFQIKRIPALVLIGPDGVTISANGRALITDYGSMGLPFTESRINEVEVLLKKEGERCPHQVSHPKHPHVLELDKAIYVCDLCKKRGNALVFSCTQCNFDLHPECALST